MKVPPRFPVFLAGVLVGGCMAFYLLPQPEPQVIYRDRPVLLERPEKITLTPSSAVERRERAIREGREYVR